MVVVTSKNFVVKDVEPSASSLVRIEAAERDDGTLGVRVLQDDDAIFLSADHARAVFAALGELLGTL